MFKRSFLIYCWAIIILIILALVGSLIYFRNRSLADIPLPGGGAIKTITLRGNVTFPRDNDGDNKKDPASGVYIRLEKFFSANGPNSYHRETTTDNTGYYEFQELPWGVVGKIDYGLYDYLRFVTINNNARDCYNFEKDISPFHITAGTSNRLDIELEAKLIDRAALKGFIRDSKTGDPIKNATISSKRDGGKYEQDASTDEKGSYHTQCNFAIDKGKLFVKANAPSYKEKEQSIDISTAGEHSLDFELESAPQGQPGNGGSGNQGGGQGGSIPGAGPGMKL